jgi:hypothetical protein
MCIHYPQSLGGSVQSISITKQDSGSESEAEIKARKKAASSTNGSAGTEKQKIDLSQLDDEAVEKLNYADL